MNKLPSSKLVTGRAATVCTTLLLVLSPVGASQAMDWQLNQSVSAAVTFSDNVDLDPDNQKEAGLTPTATYTIAGTGQSGRALFATDSRITFRGQTDQWDADIDQRITALGRLEIVRDRLFLDGLVTSFQDLVNANSSVSANPNSGRNSTNSVSTFAISPVYQEKLGTWADTQLAYQHSEILASGNNDDASLDSLRFAAVSGARFSVWKPTFATGWVDYRERLAQPTNSKDDVETVFIELDNQFQITRNYALLALVGYNEVDAPTSTRDLSGFYWSLGILATPNQRTSINFRFGQRYDEFGVDGVLSYLVTPSLTFRMSAAHSVGTSLVRSGAGFQRLTIATLQGGLGGATGLPSGFLRNNNLDDGLSTQQSVGLGLVGTYGRSIITVGSNFNNRTFDNGDDVTWTSRAAWTRQLSRLMTFNLSVAYRFVDQRNSATTHTVGGSAGVDYQLGQQSSIFASVSHTDRFSAAPTQEYSENAATIGGRLNF